MTSSNRCAIATKNSPYDGFGTSLSLKLRRSSLTPLDSFGIEKSTSILWLECGDSLSVGLEYCIVEVGTDVALCTLLSISGNTRHQLLVESSCITDAGMNKCASELCMFSEPLLYVGSGSLPGVATSTTTSTSTSTSSTSTSTTTSTTTSAPRSCGCNNSYYYLYQAVPTDRSLFTGCPK